MLKVNVNVNGNGKVVYGENQFRKVVSQFSNDPYKRDEIFTKVVTAGYAKIDNVEMEMIQR